ncbi:MAG: UDP-N-acetylmuramate--L-alanine ligase [Parcubacteria group bacterium 21-54-25]|nr:MAG: UDP-N-acetylmuramate--L-alanine ligase [Parcubacteria group bacterium 21-54-25]HQU07469.1 UDP-N-acetylmuramate--L-alanine ligase [Candidatus Paceibacterota bacterium]
MTLQGIKKAHFVGVGGIGMSALAQLFAHEGIVVSGSDQTASPTTDLLAKKGVAVSFIQSAENVPEDIDVLVYSDAVADGSEGFPQRIRARERGVPEFSLFQMLGMVSAGKRTIAIAGTHGKTTTTGMLAKILVDAGVDPTVVVGSIVKDFESNYVAGSSDWFVVEACEYHDHLLELSPEVLVINNLEWDHTDYFPSLEALQETFRRAIAKVPAHGAIVTDPHNPTIAALLSSAVAHVIDYMEAGRSNLPTGAYELTLPGEFNQNNARAAAAAARRVSADSTAESIATALADFHGTWRRFEYKGTTENGADVYDDYAHHPTAVRETIHALRAKTAGKMFIAFHPHLYSRTRDLLEDFATAFAGANDVIIAPIYAAREHDDGTISNRILAERIAATGVHAHTLETFDDITAYLNVHAKKGDTVMTMGAGDIYKVANQLVA